MKKIVCSSLITLLSVGFISCGESKINDVVADRENRDLIERNIVNEDYETVDLDFGEGKYISAAGKDLPYDKRATASFPKSEGKKKLAVIIHGRHDSENENIRFDSGFRYLTEYLAQNNYVGISIDVQAAYVWKYGDNDDNEKARAIYKEVIKELQGNEELSKRIDFDNIVLIGHSRGGETVYDIALENEGIKGIASISPAYFGERERPDVKSVIVVPEYDGDVVGLDGVPMFEEFIENENRKSDMDLIILEKANHNYFNANVLKNDLELLGDEEKIGKQLKREQQEMFLKNLMLDFMDSVFGVIKEESVFNKSKMEPRSMYGLNVKTQTYSAEEIVLFDERNFIEASSEEVTIKSLNESAFYKLDETKGFNIPMFINEEKSNVKPLLSMEWSNKGDTVKVDLKTTDISSNQIISLNLAQDSSNELNTPSKGQSFTVMIKDKKGNKSSVVIDNSTTALSYVDGEMDKTEIFEDIHYFWSEPMFISTIRIPLNLFDGVDLKLVEEINLIFDQSESGAIMLENIKVS